MCMKRYYLDRKEFSAVIDRYKPELRRQVIREAVDRRLQEAGFDIHRQIICVLEFDQDLHLLGWRFSQPVEPADPHGIGRVFGL